MSYRNRYLKEKRKFIKSVREEKSNNQTSVSEKSRAWQNFRFTGRYIFLYLGWWQRFIGELGHLSLRENYKICTFESWRRYVLWSKQCNALEKGALIREWETRFAFTFGKSRARACALVIEERHRGNCSSQCRIKARRCVNRHCKRF